MKRGKRTETPGELRERAKLLVEVEAEEVARRVLEEAWDDRELLEQRADDLELAQRVEALRDELSDAAAVAAQAAIQSRRAAEEESVEADAIAARRERAAGELEAEETKLRGLLEEVEAATARGDIDEAIRLEELVDHTDLEPRRIAVAALAAEESDARDRAAQASAAAERHAGEAAELRHELVSVEDRIRPEYEQRRRDRAQRRSLAMFALDQRVLTAAVAAEAAVSEWRKEAPPREVDSANFVDNPVRVVTDPDGRFVGVELPLAAAR